MFRSLILLILCTMEIHANTTENDFEIENRIIGGKRCSLADHKYMVAILSTHRKTFLCGGTLLSSRWVLTARHCIPDSEEPNIYMVYAGIEGLSEEYWGENMQMSVAEGCYNHPFDDIGLMNLQKSIQVSRVVGYVTLASYYTILGRKLENICKNSTVLGWGSQNAFKYHERFSSFNNMKSLDPYLQCINLRVISPRECHKKLKKVRKSNLTDSNFCAFKENADACLGDSGGPLLCNGIQYGIVSYGYGCADKDYPGIYVKVHYYESFIKATMRKGQGELSQNRSCSVIKHSFLVAIIHRGNEESYDYVCAGSMLTQIWVLTSGVCTLKCETPSYYTVVAGMNDSFRFDANDKRTISSEVIKCFQSPTHKEHWDIALMKLKNRLGPNGKVSFIRLATSLDVINRNFKKVCTNSTLIGHGQPANSTFQHLQCDETTAISDEDCWKIWTSPKFGDSHGCIDGLKSDNCYATLGAPLICDDIQYGVLTSIACIAPRIINPPAIIIAKVYAYDAFLMKMVFFSDKKEADFTTSIGDLNSPINLYNLVLFIFVNFINFEQFFYI